MSNINNVYRAFLNGERDIINLVWLGVLELVKLNKVSLHLYLDDSNEKSYFLKFSHVGDNLPYHLRMLCLEPEKLISIKEYGYYLGKFINDPLMFQDKYNIQKTLINELRERGYMKRRRILFWDKISLTDLGEQVKRESITLSVNEATDININDFKNKLLLYMQEFKNAFRTPLGMLNKKNFPKPILTS